MKKFLSLCMAIMTILCLAACQPTPEDVVVVQKDVDRLIESAIESDGGHGGSIREQYHVPEVLHDSKVHSEALSINISASVRVPEHGGMPLLRVAPADFSQDLVTKLFQSLCGSRAMYDYSRSTRQQLEEEMLLIKQVLADPQYAEDEETLSLYRSQLAIAEKKWRDAPNSPETPRCDGVLRLLTRYDQANGREMYTYYGLSAADADGEVRFHVENNNSMTEAYVTMQEGNDVQGAIPVQKRAALRYETRAVQRNYTTSPASLCTDYGVVPAKAQGELSITPSEAIAVIEPLLSGTDMTVASVALAQAESGGYAYRICYTRQIADARCTYLGGLSTSSGEDSFAPMWHYEGLEVLINNDGILLFDWVAPLQITETITASCRLMPFDEILRIFERMAGIQYAAPSNGGTERSVRIDVTEIRLELSRIAEKDTFDAGLLIPVWSFYGSMTYINEDGSETPLPGFYHDGRGELLLLLNAIDGSMIDIHKGY